MDSGGGMRALPPGKAERRNWLAERQNVLTKERELTRLRRTGTRSPSKNTPAKTQGLTISSSATAHGDARLAREKGRTAMGCSLERVVRLPAYRGASGPPELATTHRRGNEGAAAGKG